MQGLRRRAYSFSSGILTAFPFDILLLGYDLGSTNPQLTIIAEEPLPFRRRGFSPRFVVTISEILNFTGSTPTLVGASAPAKHSPTIFLSESKISVVCLVPSILEAIHLGRSAITRCLKDVCL